MTQLNEDEREEFYNSICECAEILKAASVKGSTLTKARNVLEDLASECLDHLDRGMTASETLAMIDDLHSFAEVGAEIDFGPELLVIACHFKQEVDLEIN
jgi:hypothetical protein